MDGDKRGRKYGSGRRRPPTYDDVAMRLRRMVEGTAETNVDDEQDVSPDEEWDMPPPPTYDEAVAAPSHYAPDHDVNDDATGQSDGATGGVEDLSASEAAVILRMQDDRKSYIPDKRNRNEEAIEMLRYRTEDELDRETQDERPEVEETVHVNQVETLGRATSFHSLEDGGNLPRRRRNNANGCQYMVIVGIIIFIIGFILFLGLFPASFVYVEYHEIALKQSKMTNSVDRETVYYPGCYILGPDTTLVRFQSTAHDITEDISVFTLNTIPIQMKYSVQYYLRPEEVGALYTKFMHNYGPFFQKVVMSTIRNYAAMTLTVDQFRFNRTQVERELHSKLRERLGGTCCPECCKTRMCQSNAYCSQCKQADCDPGYHIDVRYFYLMTVGIPSEVFERYLRRNVLQIESEREHFLQDHAVALKTTTRYIQQHKNRAEEIISEATAESHQITVESTAQREHTIQEAYARALKGLFSLLNVTNDEHKQSLMMILALEDVASNLYPVHGYETKTLYTL